MFLFLIVLLWSPPDLRDGEQLVAAYQEEGRIRIVANAAHVYQHMSFAATTYLGHQYRCTYYEIINKLRPEQAATREGWRSIERLDFYIEPAWDGLVGGYRAIIKTDGNNDFLIRVCHVEEENKPSE